MSSISGVYTALSGMTAQRRALDVAAHNVANQSTVGYHRQRVELQPAGVGSVGALFAGGSSQVGGVVVESVTRIVDQLAEDRYTRESALSSGAATLAVNMSTIELAFVEPSDQGLASVLDDFWGGWSDMTSLPGDEATRTQTLERAATLVDVLHRAASDLQQVATTAQNDIVGLAAEVNELTSRIAQFNTAIGGSVDPAHDLVDQRGQAMLELAQLTGAVARPASGDMIDVYIGGHQIVSGALTQSVSGAGGSLTWTRDGSSVAAGPSRAASLARTINDVVPRYLSALDGVAESLVTEVNTLHSVGYDQDGNTGWNFFEPGGVTAASISLSSDVAGQPSRLAAGAPAPGVPGPFDAEQARAIAGIAEHVSGPDSLYRSMVSGLGVETRAAVRRESIQQDVTQAAEAQAMSVGGVSLDEEMANLMSAQRGYEAAARVLTTMDELLGVLMNTGRVGR